MKVAVWPHISASRWASRIQSADHVYQRRKEARLAPLSGDSFPPFGGWGLMEVPLMLPCAITANRSMGTQALLQ
jgi:hypothetical protein